LGRVDVRRRAPRPGLPPAAHPTSPTLPSPAQRFVLSVPVRRSLALRRPTRHPRGEDDCKGPRAGAGVGGRWGGEVGDCDCGVGPEGDGALGEGVAIAAALARARSRRADRIAAVRVRPGSRDEDAGARDKDGPSGPVVEAPPSPTPRLGSVDNSPEAVKSRPTWFTRTTGRGGRLRDRAPRARRHSVAGRRVGRHCSLSGLGSLV